jgi:hypothetical protein
MTGAAAIAKPVEIGKSYRLDYPAEFTTMPDYTAHNGQSVVVLRELEDGKEYDFEGDKLFEVKAADGWTGHVFDSELVEAST